MSLSSYLRRLHWCGTGTCDLGSGEYDSSQEALEGDSGEGQNMECTIDTEQGGLMAEEGDSSVQIDEDSKYSFDSEDL